MATPSQLPTRTGDPVMAAPSQLPTRIEDPVMATPSQLPTQTGDPVMATPSQLPTRTGAPLLYPFEMRPQNPSFDAVQHQLWPSVLRNANRASLPDRFDDGANGTPCSRVSTAPGNDLRLRSPESHDEPLGDNSWRDNAHNGCPPWRIEPEELHWGCSLGKPSESPTF